MVGLITWPFEGSLFWSSLYYNVTVLVNNNASTTAWIYKFSVFEQSRTDLYKKTQLRLGRRNDLEGVNNHIVIFDILEEYEPRFIVESLIKVIITM